MNIKQTFKNLIPILSVSFEKIADLVKNAEIIWGKGNGRSKRQWVIAEINRLVDIPALPEWLEEQLIGMLVDYAVALANRWLGHDWLRRLEGKDNAS